MSEKMTEMSEGGVESMKNGIGTRSISWMGIFLQKIKNEKQ
jgi:hypothetical protein